MVRRGNVIVERRQRKRAAVFVNGSRMGGVLSVETIDALNGTTEVVIRLHGDLVEIVQVMDEQYRAFVGEVP